MNPTWQRATYLRAYDHRDGLTILASGKAHRFSGPSGDLVRILLSELVHPTSESDLLDAFAERTGSRDGLSVVSEALAHLLALGVVHVADARENERRASSQRAPARIVLCISAGIVAAYAPALVELLLSHGHSIRIAMTPKARGFVSTRALEALTHEPVAVSMWARDPREPVPHIELSRWADAVVVYPTTATTLARIAQGASSTLVSAIAIASRSPVILVPAMNETMLRAPQVERNLSLLREDGYWIAQPGLGFEAADPPSERALRIGAAPPVSMVVEITEAILAETRAGDFVTSGLVAPQPLPPPST